MKIRLPPLFVILLLCIVTITYLWRAGGGNEQPKVIFVKVGKTSQFQAPTCSAEILRIDAQVATWQLALPPSILYVYSAFFDGRDANKPIIHVISIVDNIRVSSLFCQLWSDPVYTDMTAVQGHLVYIREGAGQRYTAVYVDCPLPRNASVPYAVSITSDKCHSPRNMITIVKMPTEPVRSRTFAHCLSPLHGPYDNVDQLIETVEINRMFGVSHILIYNFSSSHRVRQVIDRYVAEGYATLIQWNIPLKVKWGSGDEPIKYFGQMAQLNDCLMRTTGRYKYTVFADLDELLVPRRDENWHQLFDRLEKQPSNTAWTFRSSFFKTQLPSDPEMTKNATIVDLNATSLLKVQRGELIYETAIRSKVILDPLTVVIVGVHNVWQFHGQGLMGALEETDGLCHHYREGDSSKAVLDRNLWRLREQIVSFVGRGRREKLKGIS